MKIIDKLKILLVLIVALGVVLGTTTLFGSVTKGTHTATVVTAKTK